MPQCRLDLRRSGYRPVRHGARAGPRPFPTVEFPHSPRHIAARQAWNETCRLPLVPRALGTGTRPGRRSTGTRQVMTQPLSRFRVLLPAASLCLLLAATPGRALADDTALSLRVDPTFARSKLSVAEQTWYDLAWQHDSGCASTVLSRSQLDDTYTYGRSIGDYEQFMLLGLRATGDRRFLDRVMAITDSMRNKLSDADDACVGGTTDGFLDWRWRANGLGYSCTNTGGFYGSDHNLLDEAMTHGNIAMAAYAFYMNRDLDPAYASRATFWLNYLQNHWEAKWIQRAGGNRTSAWLDNNGMYKHEAHVVANLMRAAYYLWRMTGDSFYKTVADTLQSRSALNCVLNPNVPSAYSWHHQVDNTTTWQAINYAEYTSSYFCDMHFEGYGRYASNTEIQKFMSTWRDIVYGGQSPSFASSSPDVYGGGTPIASDANGASVYARWDTTGLLMAYANALKGTPGATSIYTIRLITGALAAVSTRTGSGTPPPDTTPPAAI